MAAAGATAPRSAAAQTSTPAAAAAPAAQAAQPRQPGAPPAPEQLPAFQADSEQQSPPSPAPRPPGQRVGYAIVGLCRLSIEELLPAFGECEHSRLVALVSGDRAKAERLAAQYGVRPEGVYTYDTFDQIRDNPEVEVVYIVLPNGLHEEYVVRAAQAGKHVLCEKPMANTSQQARTMIDACAAAGRKLMIAYRINYETYNRAARTLIQSGELGRVKIIEALDAQNQGEPEQWRHQLDLAGGGSLPDIGIYPLNTIRWLLGEEPIEVMATTYSDPNDPRFAEVEENCLWQMRFPSGVQANCLSAYGAHTSRRFRVHMELGHITLDPAFAYEGLRMEVARAEGQAEMIEERRLPQRNQFATEIEHMSTCIIADVTPYTPGEEGLQDHLLMGASTSRPAPGSRCSSSRWISRVPTAVRSPRSRRRGDHAGVEWRVRPVRTIRLPVRARRGTGMDVKQSVQRQFGEVAASYSTSAVHVSGPELLALLDAHPFAPTDRVLDAGTGTGHTALAVAPLVAEVVAVDLTESMLDQGRALAAGRGIANVDFQAGDIEHLTFPDGAFDVVVSRYSAHHFPHPADAISEIRRVLKPGGVFLLADVVSPDDPTTDTYLNAIEVLRDPSHVRDHRVAQWRELFLAGGFAAFEHLGQWPLHLKFDAWVARMRTPDDTAAAIRSLIDIAPSEVRTALSVEPDHTFSPPVSLMKGTNALSS